jgi:hypothetical protein
MKEPFAEMVVTSDHHCVLNIGGLLLLRSESLDGAVDPDEEIDAETLARDDETVFLALPEVLQVAALIEQHRAELEAGMAELDTYFTQVARAWLDECAETARALCARGKYWWPEVRNEARHVLIRLMNDESDPVISAWSKQTRRNRHFPRDQQEELLTRYFKRLYYERYPVPRSEDEEAE